MRRNRMRRNKTLIGSLCRCIKHVRKTFRNESRAIAICVKSVLHTKGKTIKTFRCGKNAYLRTQKRRT